MNSTILEADNGVTHEGLFVATLTLFINKFVEFYISVTEPILENKITLHSNKLFAKLEKWITKLAPNPR